MVYDDDYDPRRRSNPRGSSRRGSSRSGNGRSSSRDPYDDPPRVPRRKGNNPNGASRTAGGNRASKRGEGSSPKRKKKPGSTASSGGSDDLLEAKMKAKKKKEKASSKTEDALEAKIRKKNAAASNSNARGKGGEDWAEEEKVEEGVDVYSDDDYDEENGRAYKNSRGGGGGVSSGVPVTAGETDEDGNPLFTRGGGDVRNRPPPQAGAGAALDPLREAELEKQKNKKQVNKRYADLHETGQWGGLTKWEKYGICLLTLGAIGAAVGLGVKFGNPKGNETPEPTNRPTKAPSASPTTSPSMAPTDVDYREETGLQMMINASPKLTLPQTVADLKSKSRSEMTAQEIAANYVLFLDPLDIPARDPRFMERYALVLFYYANGGCAGDWINKDNWLNGEDHCTSEWHGVVCDLQKRVIEINLSTNYVTGEIPIELGQLEELKTLDLSNNALTGAVPSEALSMSKMYTIQLNNNMLTGEFPFEDVKSESGATILDNLWIQENTGLKGTITEAYCGMNSITLDCDNFDPSPTYPLDDPEDTGYTNFQINCLTEFGAVGLPKEYTCNFDDPVPFEKPEDELESDGSVQNCGVPSVFRLRR